MSLSFEAGFRDLQQLFDIGTGPTVAVFQFAAQFIQLFFRRDDGQPLIHVYFLTAVLDVFVVDKSVDVDFHDRFRRRRFHLFPGLGLGNGFFQHMAVHGKADAGDVAVLFPAKEVAGTANFKVAHSDFKTGTEFRKFFDGLKSFFSDFRQDLVPTIQEVA